MLLLLSWRGFRSVSNVVPRIRRPPRRGDARDPPRPVHLSRPVVQVRRRQRAVAEGDRRAPVRFPRERVDDQPRVALGGELRKRGDVPSPASNQLQPLDGPLVDPQVVGEESLDVVRERVMRVPVQHHPPPLQRRVDVDASGSGTPGKDAEAPPAPHDRRCSLLVLGGDCGPARGAGPRSLDGALLVCAPLSLALPSAPSNSATRPGRPRRAGDRVLLRDLDASRRARVVPAAPRPVTGR